MIDAHRLRGIPSLGSPQLLQGEPDKRWISDGDLTALPPGDRVGGHAKHRCQLGLGQAKFFARRSELRRRHVALLRGIPALLCGLACLPA